MMNRKVAGNAKDAIGSPTVYQTASNIPRDDHDPSHLIQKPSGEARKQAAAAGISQLKEWVDFFTQAHGAENAERKLLQPITKREIEDAQIAVHEARQNEQMLRKQLAIREREISNLRGLLSMQNKRSSTVAMRFVLRHGSRRLQCECYAFG